MIVIVIKEPVEFEWDKGNIGKNQKRHGVNEKEAEEPFFDNKKKTFKDYLHSGKEERFRIIGKTKRGRLLFAAFTIRKGLVRIISVRNVNRKEVQLYEEKTSVAKV
ncbi:hypothetical protein COS54_00055 [Candidatus Shapirobacteria bacterium CG03_land_8_20_14_0_80_39_12]|uniref:BrnT family toxin n=1 Tax=Candidatus Shapirobacteria bacterium CG03_land_8_20_14_0_80_39_12 TaxID=1974879 RepID=A0A2M7BG73_9BACT|nr:MAG: hypothetical protein COS54_00055 [Candidatus Shapirobacteria bacterium CG03_land_8_20_14_0_80_39_12]